MFSSRKSSGIARVALATLSFLLLTQSHAADEYPAKPIRLLVGYGPGSSGDIAARLIASKLQDSYNYKHGIVVENKTGAGGLIAAQETARAAPDGYTLMMAAMPQLGIIPAANPKPPYDPQRDFAPITQVITNDIALLINPQRIPAKSMAEFVAWGKQQPKVFFSTTGPGTVGHLGAYMLADTAKLNIEPIHYRSPAEATGSMLQGDVHANLTTFPVAAPQVEAGKLRVLMVTGSKRAPIFPDAPTASEAGFPDVHLTSWFGVVAPANTPVAILDKLNADIVRAARSADVQKKLEIGGSQVTATTRDEFIRQIAEDVVRWSRVVKASGFKTQD